MKYHKITHLWAWFVRITTNFLPDCASTMRFRGWLHGLFMKQKGRDFQVASDVRINGLENLIVGDHVYFAPGTVILAAEGLTISDEVMLAHKVIITDGTHTLINGSYRYGKRHNAPISIGRGTWIAAHCSILSGVHIGSGVLVAANAAVTKDLPDNVLAGGVPARVLRSLSDQS